MTVESGRGRRTFRLARIGASLAIVGLVVLPLTATAAPRVDPKQVERGYRQVLSQLSQGDREAAKVALVDFESELVGRYATTHQVDRLWRLKLGVIRELIDATSLDVVVPIVILHHDAYMAYRERQYPVLARHARDMAVDLAIYKAEKSGAPEDRVFAGWVLTSFGSYLLDLTTAGTSARIFRDALEQSPDNEAALLGLAWAHEAHGEYREAVELLDRLVHNRPDHDEAKLRRATCRRRMGELDTAERELRRLLQGDTEEWIRSVAYQELGRTLLELDRSEQALEVLRRAVEELPEQQELWVLQAAILELRGEHWEAGHIAQQVVPAGVSKESARYLYGKGPELPIDEARERLYRMQEDRLTLLAASLAGGVGKSAGAAMEAGG